MYHDTIHINFSSFGSDLNFNYSFLISKDNNDKFSPIRYGDILDKFENIGFNTKYIKFNDLDLDDIVYCTYNYQPKFEIFFKAYDKLLMYKKFNIKFEYGNIINNIFHINNMNYCASIYFSNNEKELYREDVLKSRIYVKKYETFCIIDKKGDRVSEVTVTSDDNFEQDFFQRHEVKVALRKYKLGRLKGLFG